MCPFRYVTSLKKTGLKIDNTINIKHVYLDDSFMDMSFLGT